MRDLDPEEARAIVDPVLQRAAKESSLASWASTPPRDEVRKAVMGRWLVSEKRAEWNSWGEPNRPPDRPPEVSAGGHAIITIPGKANTPTGAHLSQI
jgi:hypothetical protein